MTRRTLTLLLALPLFAFGCDHAAPLLGTWTNTDPATSAKRTITFNTDGTFVSESQPLMKATRGTWSVAKDQLTMEANEPLAGGHIRATQPFYANGNQLAVPAYQPAGAHKGLIGTWSTKQHVEMLDAQPPKAIDSTESLTFADDHSVTLVVEQAGQPSTTGHATYTFDAAKKEATVTIPAPGTDHVVRRFTLVDDQILSVSDYLYTK